MFTAGLSKRCKHVLHVHGWSETDDGQLCLVMGKYGRGTLQELLDECERLPPQHVLRVSLDMASGVAELHAQNMVYNDLKPDNCLVEADGGIVLADFGVLKPLSNSNRAPTSTITQYGSPLFMAPEKLASWPGARQAATFAADVWALAVSILQVATNDPTLPYSSGFDMEDMDKMLNIDKELPEVPQLSELPGLQQLLQRCLALDPDARPSAAEVREVSLNASESSQAFSWMVYCKAMRTCMHSFPN
ncbi:kinase-like domain-containing protein [Dunaliella salina]|uniref:non-specific serine/threonine protein kinase n=1 Tax=Dunaliella salina TaxID=3046 RepID=A0ABQ7GCP7_DUNSA|nr:kinase-like domain-containing protein [Dunaliella salina]KAF5832388.1 kinase-like domain-containing protein [Dunaliella salina]|eukprot:KAF5832387.1 kinase-like domain-containing protein [Dunaliella salina]